LGEEWGVFANRDYVRGEIIEFSPLVVPLHRELPEVQDSALNDYVYGYYRIHRNHIEQMYAVIFGMAMWCNHHPTQSNVEYTIFGREPDLNAKTKTESSIAIDWWEEGTSEHEGGGDNGALNTNGTDPVFRTSVSVVGLRATRDVQKGEQLLSRYDHNTNDGGTSWFNERNIAMMSLPPVLETDSVDYGHRTRSDMYCSKIYAGIGKPSWERLLPVFPPDRSVLPFSIPSIDDNLGQGDDGNGDGRKHHKKNINNHLPPLPLSPTFDAGYGNVRLKGPVGVGDRIEIGRALVMSMHHHRLNGSVLMPLIFS
jgi:hypothetical protein